MLENMLEVKFDKELDKFVVRPVGTDTQEDYLIQCNNEFDAKSLCAQISIQMVASPLVNPLKYSSIGMHPNGHTRIFLLKP